MSATWDAVETRRSALGDLPLFAVLEVYQYLAGSVRDLGRLSQTCRYWRANLMDDEVWAVACRALLPVDYAKTISYAETHDGRAPPLFVSYRAMLKKKYVGLKHSSMQTFIRQCFAGGGATSSSTTFTSDQRGFFERAVELDFHETCVGESGCVRLSTLLSAKPCLSSLNLARQLIRTEGLRALVVPCAFVNLETLDLQDNGLDGVSLTYYLPLLFSNAPHLQCIDLSSNGNLFKNVRGGGPSRAVYPGRGAAAAAISPPGPGAAMNVLTFAEALPTGVKVIRLDKILSLEGKCKGNWRSKPESPAAALATLLDVWLTTPVRPGKQEGRVALTDDAATRDGKTDATLKRPNQSTAGTPLLWSALTQISLRDCGIVLDDPELVQTWRAPNRRSQSALGGRRCRLGLGGAAAKLTIDFSDIATTAVVTTPIRNAVPNEVTAAVRQSIAAAADGGEATSRRDGGGGGGVTLLLPMTTKDDGCAVA